MYATLATSPCAATRRRQTKPNRPHMMTSSNWNICPRYWTFVREIHRCPGNSPHKGPVTRSFGVCSDTNLNKRVSKQSWGWWFETLSRKLWRHCNDIYFNVNGIGVMNCETHAIAFDFRTYMVNSSLVNTVMNCYMLCRNAWPGYVIA